MSRGYVYALSNPSMPGLLKIGKTTRDPDSRALELYQTGVPTPFVVEDIWHSPDCDDLERRAHNHFSDHRVSTSREFFTVSLFEVGVFLDRLLFDQVQDYVDGFLPNAVLAHRDYCLLAYDVEDAAKANDLYAGDVRGILMEINAEEMAVLKERRIQKLMAAMDEEEKARNNVVSLTPVASVIAV